MRRLALIAGLILVSYEAGAAAPLGAAPLTEWPARFISYAYAIRQEPDLVEKLATLAKGAADDGGYLYRDYQNIRDYLAKADPYVDGALAFVGHYCWLKVQTGFSCGEPASRHFSDAGYFYISDRISGPKPFILMIVSGISPGRTTIFRLFEDHPELVYDSLGNSMTCALNDQTSLGVVYGVRVLGDGSFELTESNNRFTPDRERRLALQLTADSCSLSQNRRVS